MKYFETTFEDYTQICEKTNLHPDLQSQMIPERNLILYGPSGVGKYSQMLLFMKRESPSVLKYYKHITANTEKQNYTYNISDIHYEVDMEQLGCHAKLLFHEIFFQITEIIMTKPDKKGYIVCKNFHHIHSELLEIFYSYVQHHAHMLSNINLYFILITENISFLHNNIINNFHKIGIKRPDKSCYNSILNAENTGKVFNNFFQSLEMKYITNIKEIKSLKRNNMEPNEEIFDAINNEIIDKMKSNASLSELRETIYNILVFHLDPIECVYNVLEHFIHLNQLKSENINNIMIHLYKDLLYFNNNYRPIYHLENMFLFILHEIYESKKGI